MVKNVLGPNWSKFTLAMVIFYSSGCLIIYSITSNSILSLLINLVNDFFFEILETPLMNLFNYTDKQSFRKIADPIQFFGTAIFLYLIGSVKKMNTLKSNR